MNPSFSHFKRTPEAAARSAEIEQALADPQDLEDGLLCVAHETVLARYFSDYAAELDRIVLGLPLEPLPCDLPA